MDEKVIKNICELADKRSKKEILLECVQELDIRHSMKWSLILSIVPAIGICIFIIYFANPVSVASIILALFLDIELALFAVIFGAYSIFQALMRDEIIRELIKTENNILKESNQTFVNLSVMYLVDILVSALGNIITSICSEGFFIISAGFSNVVYCLLISVFLTFNFMLILENINFVINMYRMFNVYNVYRALDVMNNEGDEDVT